MFVGILGGVYEYLEFMCKLLMTGQTVEGGAIVFYGCVVFVFWIFMDKDDFSGMCTLI